MIDLTIEALEQQLEEQRRMNKLLMTMLVAVSEDLEVIELPVDHDQREPTLPLTAL